jgi:hypothetical protein
LDLTDSSAIQAMMNLATLGAAVAALSISMGLAQPPAPPQASAEEAPQVMRRQLAIANKPWIGDFDRMLERRMIRVYAPYSRSLFFNDKGRERGLSAELVRDFERWINQKYAKRLGRRPLTIYLVPATRDKLLPDLVDGLGDIAFGNLTVTPERLKVSTWCRRRRSRPWTRSSSPARFRLRSLHSTISAARRFTFGGRRATTTACLRSTIACSRPASHPSCSRSCPTLSRTRT